MIPNFNHEEAKELSLTELLGRQNIKLTDDPLEQKDEKELRKTIWTLDYNLVEELNEQVTPNNTAIQKIKDFRKFLNQAYIKFSKLKFTSAKLMCERRDLYWAKREHALTGEYRYSLPSIRQIL
jgi:hypothetical protein